MLSCDYGQPFSCQCSQNLTHCRKEISGTCLFQESIPAIPFWNSWHPLPTRSSRFLSAAARSNSSALWLHHAHPFVAAEVKNLSHAEKQRVWSRSCLQGFVTYNIALHYCIMPIPSLQLQEKLVACREAEGFVTELWSPRFVTMQ